MQAHRGDELRREDREPGEPGDADEQVAPDEGPPEITPAAGPSPFAVYPYIDPGRRGALGNWFRQSTTNSNITVPNT